ncbi:hypothetical protein A1UG_01553 [Escherichia coli KTE72]|nr:hypothetical protein A1UG_01553 [Escherichia coli KTE72]
MPLAAKLTDKGTRHDGYYETVITAGSSTVFIDGLPAARQGDPLTPHAKPKHPPHPRKIARARQPSLLTACPPPEPVMLLTAAAWLLVAVR